MALVDLSEAQGLNDNEVNVYNQDVVEYKTFGADELPTIKHREIIMPTPLGSGAFGRVYKCKIKNIVLGEAETYVAVKSLKYNTQCKINELINEAKIMNNLKHKNIVQFIGVCLDNDYNFIIMELMEEGDLLNYLRNNRPTDATKSNLNLIDLVRMCIDVASGCLYLEQMRLIHRDLACRNCLVSSSDPKEQIIKIGDFGLAKTVYRRNYCRDRRGLMPIRWMSPESIIEGIFSSLSDVWAFGIIMWEIMSLGNNPYPGIDSDKITEYVSQGGKLEKPINCPDSIYTLMTTCWNLTPNERPTFEPCLIVLKATMNTMVMEIENNSYELKVDDVELPEESFRNIISQLSSYQNASQAICNNETPAQETDVDYVEMSNIYITSPDEIPIRKKRHSW